MDNLEQFDSIFLVSCSNMMLDETANSKTIQGRLVLNLSLGTATFQSDELSLELFPTAIHNRIAAEKAIEIEEMNDYYLFSLEEPVSIISQEVNQLGE